MHLKISLGIMIYIGWLVHQSSYVESKLTFTGLPTSSDLSPFNGIVYVSTSCFDKFYC